MMSDSLAVKSPAEIQTIDDLIESVRTYYPNADFEFLKKAYTFSEKAHEGQIRRSGEPYISHPLGVAGILAELKLDLETIATGLLHDTVEDTDVTLADIKKNFGETTARLVDGVTKISLMKFRNTHEKQGENIRKMIVAMGKDVRVVLVKLADRLHNMRTLNHMSPEKQMRIAQETLDIYAPLASRLGINTVKTELEDLSFRYGFPESYYSLVQKVSKKKKEREKYIEDVKRLLTQELQKRSQVKFEIQGRPKHFWSIYRKMRNQGIEYEQIYDVLAFRICVNSVSECYEVLGIVHSLFRPIPGRFKDFIAMPKNNNYQSLHTTVIGPQAERIEIQIRTHEMHLIAEKGIAAHWQYKEGGDHSLADESTLEKFNWLRELVSLHQQTSSSDEFLENVKGDLFESEIYVFTPKGDVKELPEHSTPIDFAFSIHTDVGHKITAARVNGRIVSLKHELQNGDTVEVITSKNQTPNKDWLKYCVTPRAKTKIRSFIKTEQRRRAGELGREIAEKSFRKAGLSWQKQSEKPELLDFSKDHGCNSVDDLLVKVGYGAITPTDILNFLKVDLKTEENQEEEPANFLAKAFKSAVSRTKRSGSLIRVDGLDDVLVRFGKCCNPIPGDPILGYITRGRGLVIHRADCAKAFELDQDRRIDVEWNQKKDQDTSRTVRLRVLSKDVPGLLKDMSEVFSSQGVNILNAQARTTKDLKAVCLFDVTIKDTKHLSEVIAALSKLKGILGVTRITRT
ncbi:MAG: GTP pyrophosphokinase [Bdellovibrionaceae bacterium]|nr:GTP pyrophosphokinase [Pseudobdellovibrionaceae bacterium]|tara:strand:+ start:24369 stop:26591 length:2223 start_codon:yes stop_codon:yes gene_type:complete